MKRKFFIAAVITIFGLFLLSMSTTKPENLGLQNGKLSPLPDSPNAVSTQTSDSSRKLSALDFSGHSPDDALEIIIDSINSLPRSRIIEKKENYVHAEFRSMIFRFVDDVECYIDDDESQIHFRSASRIGHSDMGANRRRMLKLSRIIRSKLNQ